MTDPKILANNRKWAKANADKIKAKDKAYYEKNKAARIAGVQDRLQKHREANDDVWKRFKERQVKSSARRREIGKELIESHKLKNPCPCGESDPVCLQFHHRNPSEKEYGVAKMITFSRERIEKEIAKCDIICSNCHLKLHAALHKQKTR